MNGFHRAAAVSLAGMIFLLFSACAEEPTRTPAPRPTAGVTLTPYTPVPLQPDVTETPTRVSSPTPPPTPTPTPYRYEIIAGDTLLGVAFRFGITLEELLAANPGIDPQFLTIGDSLVIPLADNPAAAVPVPTPVQEVVPAGAPVCWPGADGGIWCFALYENQGTADVEDLAATLNVYGREGELLASRTAVSPMNLLPAGASLPVAAWFPGFAEDFGQVTAVLASALAAAPGDGRYVPVVLEHEVELDGGFAKVAGRLSSGGVGSDWSKARVAAVAYDAEGRVVGVRISEIPSADGTAEFSLRVFSTAGAIERVDVLAEAYP